MSEEQELDGVNRMWEERMMNNAIEKVTKVIPSIDLLRKEGGSWLGCVRSWIQRKAINGEEVRWGSQDYLNMRSGITVWDMEVLAADIAEKALTEFKNSAEFKKVVKAAQSTLEEN